MVKSFLILLVLAFTSYPASAEVQVRDSIMPGCFHGQTISREVHRHLIEKMLKEAVSAPIGFYPRPSLDYWVAIHRQTLPDRDEALDRFLARLPMP